MNHPLRIMKLSGIERMCPDLDIPKRVRALSGQLGQLLNATPCRVEEYLEKVPRSNGVYVFSEPKTGWMYVGVSVGKANFLRARIGQHIPNIPPDRPRRGSAAILAERMAMEALQLDTNVLPAAQRYASEDFRIEFHRLSERIGKMDLRWLEIASKQEAKDLEKFAVVVLQPRYNR